MKYMATLSAERQCWHQKGRCAKFEALALPIQNSLYTRALRLVREPAKADDMVQDTYLRAWQNFDRFMPGSNFKAWAFQILTFLILNERRNKRQFERTMDFFEQDYIETRAGLDVEQRDTSASGWEQVYDPLPIV
jgi:RNA polymerase sigma factor (sigma-70 family)